MADEDVQVEETPEEAAPEEAAPKEKPKASKKTSKKAAKKPEKATEVVEAFAPRLVDRVQNTMVASREVGEASRIESMESHRRRRDEQQRAMKG